MYACLYVLNPKETSYHCVFQLKAVRFAEIVRNFSKFGADMSITCHPTDGVNFTGIDGFTLMARSHFPIEFFSTTEVRIEEILDQKFRLR